jgi:hypothetical protein
MATVTLIVEHGCLATPGEACKDPLTRQYILRDNAGIILMHYYQAGDVDTFVWPKSPYWSDGEYTKNLINALYGAREMGHVPSDTDRATLPDGSTVEF